LDKNNLAILGRHLFRLAFHPQAVLSFESL